MKNIIRIWNDEHDFMIGLDGVTNIAVYDVAKDGTITYRVIQGGEVHYPKSKNWKETAQLGFFD